MPEEFPTALAVNMTDALVDSMNRRKVGSASNVVLERFNFLQFRKGTSYHFGFGILDFGLHKPDQAMVSIYDLSHPLFKLVSVSLNACS